MSSIKMVNLQLLILAVITTTVLVSGQRRGECCQEYCYSMDNERPQSAHYGTKTSYLIAKGPESGKQYLVPNCTPVKIWIYARHGSRLPDAEKMMQLSKLGDLKEEIIANYEQRHSKPAIGAMCEPDLELLKEWNWNRNMTPHYSSFLTVQGWEELKFLAIRYQRIFPNIFENVYDPNKFLFRYTDSQRTEASFKAFTEGLFGPGAYERIHIPPPPHNDTLLQASMLCPALNQTDFKADGSEYKKFLQSQTITQLVSDVSQRLGFRFPLNVQHVLDMLEMCRYDQAWKIDRPSPWCAAFTPAQIDDLEYLNDVYSYYKFGYGRKLNSRIQCAAVNDMLYHLESNNQPNDVVYFTHAKSIILLLTALKAMKDSDSLRADNYYSMSRRKWRLSESSPFAANLAAIKYNCPNEVEREKVIFYLNEKPLTLDWCKVGLCNWSDVKKNYKEFSQAKCDEYFCNSSANTSRFFIVLIAIAPLITIAFQIFIV